MLQQPGSSERVSIQTGSPVTALLRQPVEQPPLMSTGFALELQHARTGANFPCRLVTLRAGDIGALRGRLRCVLLCNGTMVRIARRWHPQCLRRFGLLRSSLTAG